MYRVPCQKPWYSVLRISIRLIHLTHQTPYHPGTTIRMGEPWRWLRDSPLSAQAMIVSRATAFSHGRPLAKQLSTASGCAVPLSRPCTSTLCASPRGFDLEIRLASGTPVHSPMLAVPLPRGVPGVTGLRYFRPAPAHSTIAGTVLEGNCLNSE